MESDMETKLLANEMDFLKNIDKPALHNLAYVLRHPELWPEGFVWNFNRCNSCAMGLAHQLWFATAKWSDRNEEAPSYMARAFAMPLGEAKEIFMDAGWSRKKLLGYHFGRCAKFSTISPEMVAEQIDLYIKRAE